MKHVTPILLSDLVVRDITDDDANSIIAKAINEQKLSGNDLHTALVVSGAALGIDKLQAHVIAHMNAGMGIMRKTLADIDAASLSFTGDDEGQAIIAKLRAPIVERIRTHIGMFVASAASSFEQTFGVAEEYVLSRRTGDTDTDEWLDASIAAAMRQPTVFYGFILADVSKMKCACSGHLLEVLAESSQPTPAEIMRTAREKFGSYDMAAVAYLKHILQIEFDRLDKFEAEFGNLDSADSAEASEATSAILSRYLGGAVPPGTDTDPH